MISFEQPALEMASGVFTFKGVIVEFSYSEGGQPQRPLPGLVTSIPVQGLHRVFATQAG